MTRAHSALTGTNATVAPGYEYEYRIDRHDRRLLLVRRRWTGDPWARWGMFDTPRQAVNAIILLNNPSEDEGKSQVLP